MFFRQQKFQLCLFLNITIKLESDIKLRISNKKNISHSNCSPFFSDHFLPHILFHSNHCAHAVGMQKPQTPAIVFFALSENLFRSCSTGPRQSITLASLTNPNQPNRSGMSENLSHPVSAGRQIHVVKLLHEEGDEVNTVLESQKNDRRANAI